MVADLTNFPPYFMLPENKTFYRDNFRLKRTHLSPEKKDLLRLRSNTNRSLQKELNLVQMHFLAGPELGANLALVRASTGCLQIACTF